MIAALLTLPLTAQSFPARTFGPQDGLQNRSVVSFAQDAEGFVWVATQNGLFRNDGAQFRKFSRAEGLADPFLSNLWISPGDTVWAATASGLFYSDPHAEVQAPRRFAEVRLANAPIVIRGNSRFAALDGGRILVATSSGAVLVLDRNAGAAQWTAQTYTSLFSPLTTKQPVSGIFRDRAGTLWSGCGQSICRRDLTRPGVPTDVLAGVPAARYEMFFEERSGRVWARSDTSVVTWMPGGRTVRDLTPTLPTGVSNTYNLRIAQDSFGSILLTTATGFLTWDGSSWLPTDATTAGALAGATDLLTDREGDLWIGTAGSGAFESLGYRQWQNFGSAEGLGSPLTFAAVTTRDKTAWVGTKLGVDRLPAAPNANGTARTFVPSALNAEKGIKWMGNLVPTADGGVWAASDEGRLWHLDAQGRIDSRVAMPAATQRVRIDSQGTVWIASKGLYSLRCHPPAPCHPEPSSDPLLAKENFTDMVFDRDGTLWLAGARGLYRLSNGVASHIDTPGVPGRSELVALGADHTVWLAGSFPGIIRVRADATSGPAGTPGAVVESHSGQDLTSDYVEILESDARGRLWVGSDQGISVLEGGRFTRITDQDGLIWNDTDWRAFFQDPDGSLWLGTSGGVSHLLHPEAVLGRKPFSAAVEDGTYDNVALAPGVSVPWSGGILTLHFSGITFRNNRSLLYRYRLEGFDAKTVDTHAPFVRFQQLPPGWYTFHVTAEDTDHHVVSSPAEISFYLVPPWWRTFTFKMLIVIALIWLAVLLWFWSNKALLAQRGKLQKLVAERTAELERLAVTDALTGLLNRGAIMSALDTEARRARKEGTPLCVAILDLDHFKRVNDTLGHPAGDEVLREAARRLGAGIRAADSVGRYGGEEFLIILRDIPMELGQERCETLRCLVSDTPIEHNGHQMHITASIGIAWTRSQLLVEDTLVARADQALYRAKENGRNRVELACDEVVAEPALEAVGV